MHQANFPKNDNQNESILDNNYKTQIQNFCKMSYSIDNFDQLVNSIASPDIIKQHYGMIGVRKLLSKVQNPPIQAVLLSPIVGKIFQFVKQKQYLQLQYEAAWILVNISSGTEQQSQAIVKLGAIYIFVQLLHSTNISIIYHGVWGISNLCSDSSVYRDEILKLGAVPIIVKIAQIYYDNNSVVSHCSWALSNICRSKPIPQYKVIKEAIPIFCNTLTKGQAKDDTIVSDCCWAISYYSEESYQIKLLMKFKLVPIMILHLSNPMIDILVPSIRILGNIATGKDDYSNELVEAGILPAFEKLLDHPKKLVRRQICWTLSNIAVSNQIMLTMQALIDKLLLQLTSDDYSVRRQICYIFSHLTSRGQPSSILGLFKDKQVIDHYAQLLKIQDKKTVETALECIKQILQYGQKYKLDEVNVISQQLLQLSVQQTLEEIINSNKFDCQSKAQLILDLLTSVDNEQEAV